MEVCASTQYWMGLLYELVRFICQNSKSEEDLDYVVYS